MSGHPKLDCTCLNLQHRRADKITAHPGPLQDYSSCREIDTGCETTSGYNDLDGTAIIGLCNDLAFFSSQASISRKLVRLRLLLPQVILLTMECDTMYDCLFQGIIQTDR